MSARRGLVGNTFSLAIARALYGATLFVATALVARTLGVEEVGLFGLAIVIGFFAAILADAGVSLLLVPLLARTPTPEWGEIWRFAWRFQLITALPAAAVFALLVVVAYDGRAADLLLLSIPWWLMIRLTLSLRAILTVSERLGHDAVASLVETTITITAVALSLAIYDSAQLGILSLGLGATFGTLIRAVAVTRILREAAGGSLPHHTGSSPEAEAALPRGEPRSGIGSTRDLLREALQFNVFNVFSVIYSRADAVLISALASSTALGLYQGPVRLVTAALLLPEALGMLMQGRVAREPGNPAIRAGQQRILNLAFGLSAVGVLAVAIFGDELLALLFGAAFAAGGTAFAILAACVPVRLASYFNGNELVAHDLQPLRTRCLGGTAAFAITAGIPAIVAFGIEGAAAVTLASELLVGILYAVMVRRHVGAEAVLLPFASVAAR